jgi:hypothetical protein
LIAAALAPNPTITITSLSPELQMLLFKCMPLEDAVCLSLTNKSSWKCLKAAYPNSFPLKFISQFVSITNYGFGLPPSPLDNLHLRLRTWMEPRTFVDFGRYRLPCYFRRENISAEMKQEFRDLTGRKSTATSWF